MNLEQSLAICALLTASLSAWHALATRPRRDAVLLILFGVGFGYIFPFIETTFLRDYGFHGDLTVLGLPFHLGLTWFSFYYLAWCLTERIVGNARPWRFALAVGIIFGLLEVQWDYTLLEDGMMEFFIPSFAKYAHNFHPGVPMFHALLGFNWAYAFLTLRDSPRPIPAALLGLGFLVVNPLSVMICVPLIKPMFLAVSPHIGVPLQVTLDVLHFSSTFVGVGIVAAWLLRLLGKGLRR